MALVYFDSSALVKLLLAEVGRDLARELWDSCDAALTSYLSYPEVCAALSAARRNHELSTTGHATARRSWEEFWDSVRPVEFTDQVARSAGHLAMQHSLRGSDAVHLASAIALEDPTLVVAVWDRRLRDAAIAAGFSVAPARD